jgi:hypothetical protein
LLSNIFRCTPLLRSSATLFSWSTSRRSVDPIGNGLGFFDCIVAAFPLPFTLAHVGIFALALLDAGQAIAFAVVEIIIGLITARTNVLKTIWFSAW